MFQRGLRRCSRGRDVQLLPGPGSAGAPCLPDPREDPLHFRRLGESTTLSCSNREDPRLWVFRGSLMCSYTYFRHGAQVRFSKLTNELEGEVSLDLNRGLRWEKNWSFFEADQKLFCVYEYCPLAVYEVNGSTTSLVQVHRWTLPPGPRELRGGAPPVVVDGDMFLFLHCTKYDVYALVLDPTRPFNIRQVPKEPLLQHPKRVFFPCGVLYEPATQTFLVTMGIDDRFIGVLRRTKTEVLASLRSY